MFVMPATLAAIPPIKQHVPARFVQHQALKTKQLYQGYKFENRKKLKFKQ